MIYVAQCVVSFAIGMMCRRLWDAGDQATPVIAFVACMEVLLIK